MKSITWDGLCSRAGQVNARADTVTTKPAFRDAWRRGQRCLVVTNGFYEWRKSDKQPFAIGVAAEDGLMVMAGLWDDWTSPAGERIRSCTVITTDANDAVGALHDRMPVIVDEKDWPKWPTCATTLPIWWR